jgi:hypothetical protein
MHSSRYCLILLLVPAVCLAQSPPSSTLATAWGAESPSDPSPFDLAQSSSKVTLTNSASFSRQTSLVLPSAQARFASNNLSSAAVEVIPKPAKQHFDWGRALFESFTLFGIEQAYVVHDDYRWVVSENGVPLNHYWRDYKQSLSSWIHSGWNDGDPNMYGYLGHPIQGLATSYIQIQNDPQSEKMEFSNTKAYWKRVLKATLFNAVYSTQWNIGPLSEPTIEKYGTKDRPPWNTNGSWPCNTKHCYTGIGQIDLVMTPVGGMGWLVGEDWLDKNVTRRVEAHTTNRLLIDTVRCGVNPIMVGTNVLHGKRPWYRASRDGRLPDMFAQARTEILSSAKAFSSKPPSADPLSPNSSAGLH